ncbi:hypothetical protein, conserved [Eimeria praecox]|uniref:Transmembrane protein n=1 Tax=Eimeria praecox TaxID=51316 RepID=U6H7B4_9EIME|nr:hypothetical protein, conserved [Eimeria praecox]
MASPLHPLLGGVLLSFGSIEGIGEEPLSAPERKATPERNLERACLQRPLKGKCGYFSLVCLLNVAFVSLVVVYFLVRCFDVTRERHRVGRLTRSLAAGGDSPCRGDGDEEDGEGSENEDAGIGNFEKPAFQQQAEGASVGSLVGQTQDTPRRPSLLTVAIPWGLRGNNGFANGREHATTSAVEGGYAQVLGNLNYSGGRMGRLQNPESQGPPQPGPGRRGAGNDENDQVNVEVRLLEGETLEMWEGRNLPPYAETRLLSVFKRMMEAASACRSVLGVVSERQRLQLSCEVMRLLGLELGALSLVRQHLEPLRSDLGCAVLQLGFDALKHTASLPTIETHCEPVRNLIALIIELKQPRPPTEENVALRYRKKMVSVLQTATTVVGYCLGVLEGLLKLKDGESLVVPSIVVEQQIGVIKALPQSSHNIFISSAPVEANGGQNT